MSTGVHLVRRDQDTLEIHLLGAVAAPTVDALLQELQDDGGPLPPHAILDLRQLTDITMEARARLVDVLRHLMATTERRAWLASSPQFRGVALWVVHVSPDAFGHIVGHLAQARAWLESDHTRADRQSQAVQTYASHRRGT